MKLGGKNETEDIFCEQLRQEGQKVFEFGANVSDKGFIVIFLSLQRSSVPKSENTAVETSVNREKVHLKSVEKISATVKRDGVLENAEIFGSM